MVVPLIIIGVIAVAGAVAVWKGGDSGISKAIENITTTKSQKIINEDKQKFQLKKDKRGLGENIYGFLFGEGALLEVNKNPQKAQVPLTGKTRGQSRYARNG